MTNLQVVLAVVISSIINILFLFFAGYFFKAWGKVVVYIPDSVSVSGFDHYVASLDFCFTLAIDEAHNFGSVSKARKAVRKLEEEGIKGTRILEVYSVHKTGWRKSLPLC